MKFPEGTSHVNVYELRGLKWVHLRGGRPEDIGSINEGQTVCCYASGMEVVLYDGRRGLPRVVFYVEDQEGYLAGPFHREEDAEATLKSWSHQNKYWTGVKKGRRVVRALVKELP